MAFKATHKFARIACSKVRRFADLIRGQEARKGLELLRFEPNRGARMLEKVLKSAMANAENGGARNVDHMKIIDARVDGGPMFKRVFPRARGMAFLIRRRFSHIQIAIEQAVAK